MLIFPIDFGEAVAEESRVVVRPILSERLLEHGFRGDRIAKFVAVKMHHFAEGVRVVFITLDALPIFRDSPLVIATGDGGEGVGVRRFLGAFVGIVALIWQTLTKRRTPLS